MSHKTPEQIAGITEGAKRLGGVMRQILTLVEPGMTGLELSNTAEKLIRESGGKPAFKGYGNPAFPAALCVSINSCVVHGVPGTESFKEGDLVGLDIGMIYNGFFSDMARTVAIGNVLPRELEMISTAQHALDTAIALVKPGVKTGDIGAAVQELVESRKFGVVRDLAGHGVGLALHEPPEIPNFGTQGAGVELKAGMIIALEPMITMGDWRVTTAADQWSVITQDGSKTAHVEDMVLVTESGYSILTR